MYPARDRTACDQSMLDSCVTTMARETRPVFTFEKALSIFEVIQVEMQSIFVEKSAGTY